MDGNLTVILKKGREPEKNKDRGRNERVDGW